MQKKSRVFILVLNLFLFIVGKIWNKFLIKESLYAVLFLIKICDTEIRILIKKMWNKIFFFHKNKNIFLLKKRMNVFVLFFFKRNF